jgi:hypothetical protein
VGVAPPRSADLDDGNTVDVTYICKYPDHIRKTLDQHVAELRKTAERQVLAHLAHMDSEVEMEELERWVKLSTSNGSLRLCPIAAVVLQY